MQFVVKFAGIIAIALFFTSCHNDVPGLPSATEVNKLMFCKYQVPDSVSVSGTKDVCKSTYEISVKECIAINAPKDTAEVLFCDTACKVQIPLPLSCLEPVPLPVLPISPAP